MTEKQHPLGTCDNCLGPIPPDLGNFTSKGRPRLYCGRDCQNTANSRAGNPERIRKLHQAVARGTWQNPAEINPPDPANIGAGVSRARRAEVERGEWRNPALDQAARVKLSRPRKHEGVLHGAIEKLKAGLKMADLTPKERAAYREYRAELRRKTRAKTRGKTP